MGGEFERSADTAANTLPGDLLLVIPAVLAGVALALLGQVSAKIEVAALLAIIAAAGAGFLIWRLRDPARNMFWAVAAALPVAATLVPPRHFLVSAFDVAMALVFVLIVWRRLFARGPERPTEAVQGEIPVERALFPTRSLVIVFLTAAPIFIWSRFPPIAALALLSFAAYYAFFLMCLRELARPGGFRRLVLLWSTLVIVMSLASVVGRLAGMQLSLSGVNINQLGEGLTMNERASGFFQDPQKAAQFFACSFVFLLVLTIRSRFEERALRWLLPLAMVFAFTGIVVAVSRASLLAAVVIGTVSVLLFNRWSTVTRLVVAAFLVGGAFAIYLLPAGLWLSVLPADLAARFSLLASSYTVRSHIWYDTWEMFADHRLTGIGPGSFRPYLLETRPTVKNFYDIGNGTGFEYIPDQPESGYFKIFYEGGLLGSAAALLLAVEAIRRFLRVAVSRQAADEARTDVCAAFAAVMVFALSFVTLFISDPPNLALLMFLLALIWHRSLHGGFEESPASAPVAAPAGNRAPGGATPGATR